MGETMSRAFVGDDQYDAADDEAPELKIPVPPGSRNYLTPDGAAALADELRELETERRPRLLAELNRLGASVSEASPDELSRARRELGRVNRRLEYLGRMASMAETIAPPDGGYDRVRFGAGVTVEEEGGAVSAYRIVGIDEADPERGLVGWTSPIARALMGKRPGDEATVALPEGTRRLMIVSIG